MGEKQAGRKGEKEEGRKEGQIRLVADSTLQIKGLVNLKTALTFWAGVGNFW